MAGENQIRLHISTDYKDTGMKAAEKDVKKLGRVSQKSSKQMTDGHVKTEKTLESLGNRFRYLSLVVGVTAGIMVMATKSFVDSYKEYERGMLGLNVMAKTTGQSMEDATGIAMKYSRTGLMSISQAALTVQNLLAGGLNLEQVDKLMQGALDTSVFLHEEMYTVGSAVEKMSFGFRVLNERNIDAIGINQRLNKTYKDYEEVVGKTTEQFTELDRHMAVYNKLIQETSRYTGGAEFAMNTLGGTMDRMSANIEILKIRMGEALVPIIGTLSEKITDLVIKFTDFISANKEAVAGLQVGLVVLTTFLAALAMMGAMLPMITVGFAGLIAPGGLAAMAIASIKVTAVVLALLVALGGLTILLLKVTGKWDKWSDSIRKNIDLISRVFKEMPLAAEKATAATLENYAKFTKQLATMNRDYEESLMELARKHSQTIDKLEADLAKLQKDEAKYLKIRKRDYDEAMSDMDEAHKDRIFELKRDLREEESLGIRADQEKIRDLQERIAEEEKEYAKDKKRKQRDYKEDVADYKESAEERQSTIETQLEEEYELRKKHKEEYEQWRNFAFLDEFEKMKRTHEERVEQIDEQISKLGLTEEQIKNIGNEQANVNSLFDETGQEIEELLDPLTQMILETAESKKQAEELNSTWGMISQTINNLPNAMQAVIPGARELVGILEQAFFEEIQKPGLTWYEKAWKVPGEVGSILGELADLFSRKTRSYQFGGIVPGSPSQRVPAILHGGERVIPSNQAGQLAPIVININNPIVRKDEDIRKMTNSIEKVLARRIQLQRLGAK